jgi:hypothetical protein
MPRRQLLFGLLLSVALPSAMTGDTSDAPTLSARQTEAAAFVAYYWRARPGRVEEYNDYIRRVAEPIDEDARKAGLFEEVRTVLPVLEGGAAAPDWTHLRIFRLRNRAAVAGLSAGLDAATARVVPDEAQRKANSARSAELRDFVRREVWTELR